MRIVVITEDYYNERPQTVAVDLDSYPEDSYFRKAVEGAIANGGHTYVSYDLFNFISDGNVVDARGQVVDDTVTLQESGNNRFVDPYLPEDYEPD